MPKRLRHASPSPKTFQPKSAEEQNPSSTTSTWLKKAFRSPIKKFFTDNSDAVGHFVQSNIQKNQHPLERETRQVSQSMCGNERG